MIEALARWAIEHPPPGSSHRAKIRARVVLRDGWRCRHCGVEVEARHGLTVGPGDDERFPRRVSFDHLVPACRGGRWTLANIVVACRACNARKGARPLVDCVWSLLHPSRKG